MTSGRDGNAADSLSSACARAISSPEPASVPLFPEPAHAAPASAITTITVPLLRTPREGIIGSVPETRNQDAGPVYADRATGQVFPDATAMVNAYLARFAERAGTPLQS